MSETTGTTATADAEAHGGPTMSQMAAGGTGTSGSGSSGTARSGGRQESPAGPGRTGDERRDAVDSVGGSEGLPGRVLGMLRERPVAVGTAVLACLAVLVIVVVRALRRT